MAPEKMSRGALPFNEGRLALEAPDGTIDAFFWPSPAAYLVIPRSILQSMPADWQRELVGVLDELADAFDFPPRGARYTVMMSAVKGGGWQTDPYRNHDKGRRRVEPKQAKNDKTISGGIPPMEKCPKCGLMVPVSSMWTLQDSDPVEKRCDKCLRGDGRPMTVPHGS